jgi:hypothetical protein
MNSNKSKIADKLLQIHKNPPKINFNKKKFSLILLYCIIIILVIFSILYFYYKYNNDYNNISFWKFLRGKSNNTQLNMDVLKNNIINKINEDQCCAVELPEDKCIDDKEVFHIANQDFSYDQAKCKCESYGGTLATYNQLVEAHNKGGDWCSYGWSDGQTAYYPTQQESFDILQEGHENDKDNCGTVGLNGGIFIDPTIKFGVNCFGIKPKGKVVKFKNPIDNSNDDNNISFCDAPQNYEANNPLTTDEILPLNNSKWSSL